MVSACAEYQTVQNRGPSIEWRLIDSIRSLGIDRHTNACRRASAGAIPEFVALLSENADLWIYRAVRLVFNPCMTRARSNASAIAWYPASEGWR